MTRRADEPPVGRDRRSSSGEIASGRQPYARKLILHAPPWDAPALVGFVEDALRDGVVLVCVVRPDCERVEDVIDELVVGRGFDESRILLTSSHPGETLDAVRAFAAGFRLCVGLDEPIQELWLAAA